MAMRTLYCVLVVLRIAFAFAPGYIHPDEWFQFGEILSGDLFDSNVLKTWEFDTTYPCRSMASIRLFGWAYALLGQHPSAQQLFAVSRVTYLLYSFVLDWCAWQLLPRAQRWRGMCIVAGSGAMLAFCVRSFSNNIEAILLAFCFVAVQRLRASKSITSHMDPNVQAKALDDPNGKWNSLSWYWWSSTLGVLMSIGLFSRFTFIVFVIPSGWTFAELAWSRGTSTSKRKSINLVHNMASTAIAAIVTASLHIIYDTWYYSTRDTGAVWPPVITPINAALYNVSIDNVSSHGLHPRWLHIVVNAPLLLGVGPWFECLALVIDHLGLARTRESQKTNMQNSMLRLMAKTMLVSLAVLSVIPHQEPRFLLPLLFPACILFSFSLSSNRGIMNIGTAVFFGLLHQGGTLPAMLNVSRQLLGSGLNSSGGEVQLLFWRSFMPPRHLVIPNGGDKVVALTDCQSMPVDELIRTMGTSANKLKILFAPSWVLSEAVQENLRQAKLVLTPLTRQYFHMDTDHLGESLAVYGEGQTLWQSFSFSAYGVERSR